MNYVIGSAVEIRCEIDQELVATTTISLESLFDPDGNEILSTQPMGFDEEETNVAFIVWQSTDGVDPVGRYEYIVKSVNGINQNLSKGFFYLEAR